MDPFTPNPHHTNPQPDAVVHSPKPVPLTPTPPKISVGKPNQALWISMTVLYIIVLVIGIFGVYAWQNSKLTAVQKSIAAAQNAPKPPDESSNIESDKYAAVFLSGGQVYFGNIAELNPQFLTLTHVYYLRTNNPQIQSGPASSATAKDISLVKLGCELHGPTDKMVINRSQVDFWENLKTDGQVSKAIISYAKQNPDGQKCI